MATLIRRFASGRGLALTLLLFGLLLVLLILMGRATTNSAKFGQMYGWLLLVSAIGLGALASLIPVSYTHLDVYKRQPRISAALIWCSWRGFCLAICAIWWWSP